MGSRWRCKRLFKFKKKPVSPRSKQGQETSRTLKQQQTLFHRIMMKQAMLQEGLLQVEEYNRDKNDVLAVVIQDSEAEWPSLTRSKLLFLQDLLQAGLIADSEYHSAKRPILERLAQQGADVSYTDFVMDPVRNSLRNSIRKSRSVLQSYTRSLASSVSASQFRERESDSLSGSLAAPGAPGEAPGKTTMQHLRAAVGRIVPGMRGGKGQKSGAAEDDVPATPVVARQRRNRDRVPHALDFLPYGTAPQRDAPHIPLPHYYRNNPFSPPREEDPVPKPETPPAFAPAPPQPFPETRSPEEAVTPDVNAVESVQAEGEGQMSASPAPLPPPPMAKGKDTIFRGLMRKLSGLAVDPTPPTAPAAQATASESPQLPFTVSPSGLHSPGSKGGGGEGGEQKQRVWGGIRPAKRLIIEPIRRSQEKSRRTRDVTGVKTPGAASGNRRELRQPPPLEEVGEEDGSEYEEEDVGEEAIRNGVEGGDSLEGKEGGNLNLNLTDLPLPRGLRGEAVPTSPTGRVLTDRNQHNSHSNNTSDLKKKLSGWQASGHGTAPVKSVESYIKEGLIRLRADLMQAYPNAKVGITSEQVLAIAARKPADSADLLKHFPRQWVNTYGSQVLSVVDNGVRAHMAAAGHKGMGSLSQATHDHTLPESGGSNPLTSAGGGTHQQSTNYSVNQIQANHNHNHVHPPTQGRQRWVESFPGEDGGLDYGGAMPTRCTQEDGKGVGGRERDGGSKGSGATWASRGRQGRKADPIPSFELLQENMDPAHAPTSRQQPSRLGQGGGQGGGTVGRGRERLAVDNGESLESMGLADDQPQGGGGGGAGAGAGARVANQRAGAIKRKPAPSTRGGVQRANPAAPVNLKERAARRAAFVKHAKTMPAGANTSTFFGADKGGGAAGRGERHAGEKRHPTVAARTPRGIPSMGRNGEGGEEREGGEEGKGTYGRGGGQQWRGGEEDGGVEHEGGRAWGRRVSGGSELEFMGEGEEGLKSRPRRTHHYRNPSRVE